MDDLLRQYHELLTEAYGVLVDAGFEFTVMDRIQKLLESRKSVPARWEVLTLLDGVADHCWTTVVNGCESPATFSSREEAEHALGTLKALLLNAGMGDYVEYKIQEVK